jgi:hypothetical protein
MKIFAKNLLVGCSILLVGCGGGGSSSVADTKAYQNKKLPVIKNDTIPDILLSNNTSLSPKEIKLYKEIGEISSGFITLKEKANFFYKKQLEMNMELGYIDSVWDQINTYCKEKNICNIPNGKIIFTYTSELYNRDMNLIEEYKNKSQDINTYEVYREDLKSLIGEKFELISAQLIIDKTSKYKYTLTTEQLEDEEEDFNLERSIIKWNDDNSSYFIREELEGTFDDKDHELLYWTQFEYIETDGEKINKFSNADKLSDYEYEILELKEKDDGSIYFVQDNPSNYVSYHAEGILTDEGGKMTFSDTEDYYLYETFDAEGMILTTVNCIGAIDDPAKISDEDTCSIQDPHIIKNILLENIYTLGVPFRGENDFSPKANAKYHTMLRFDNNDSILAIVNCSTYTANYKIEEYGISFSNTKKTVSPELKCIYPEIQSNFEKMLKDGLPFMEWVGDPTSLHSHFNTIFGLWPNLHNINRVDFDLDKFYEDLYANEYVDSPLMNSVLKVKYAIEYHNLQSGKDFLLMSSPSIKVENQKIIIDLVDAIFDADIEVVDPTHIKFTNINRIDKDNVVYPDDVNLTCEEDVNTEDECFEDPYTDPINSDKVFANIIDDFLHETIEVYLYATNYTLITFKGTKLSCVVETEDKAE